MSTEPLRDPPVIKGHNVGGSYSPEAHAGLGSRVWILYILLPSPFRGSTHISLYQSWFDLSRNGIERALYTEVFRTHAHGCSNESPVYAITYRNVTRGHSHKGGHRSLYLALNTSKHMRFRTIASPKIPAMQMKITQHIHWSVLYLKPKKYWTATISPIITSVVSHPDENLKITSALASFGQVHVVCQVSQLFPWEVSAACFA